MRAAIYTRVSTEDQANEGFSLEAQLKRLMAYCKARGWKIAAQYIDDGYSGRSTNRPAYRRMMEENDSWDVLLVLKMDRIHRNSMNFTLMMNDLKEWGKEFNSMQESFDTTTAIGRFVMDIIQRIAQLESEQIGERVKIGMEQKARKGEGYLGFGQPYGYLYKNGSLETIDDEARVVERMFVMYRDGHSLQAIADELNDEAIPSKKDRGWSKQAISKILKNPLYCGHVRWDGHLRQAEHEAVVSVEEFNRVQVMFGKRSRNPDSRRYEPVRVAETVSA